jgi:anti-sigma factor RsiW
MNCESFQNELHEYVDGILSAGARADAGQHLAGCDACRRLLQKEEQLARVLAVRLRQSSEALALAPEIRRNILAAARDTSTTPTAAESITNLWRYWLRLAAIPAVSLLVIAAFLFAPRFSGKHAIQKVQKPAPLPVVSYSPRPAVSVQISYRVPAYKFDQEGNGVIDSLSYETVAATGTFQPGGHVSFPENEDLKTPL